MSGDDRYGGPSSGPLGRGNIGGRGGRGGGGGGRPEYLQQAKVSLVKNRAPAPVQITAEQLLREARDRVAAEQTPVESRIQDAEELQSYRCVLGGHVDRCFSFLAGLTPRAFSVDLLPRQVAQTQGI